RDLAVEVEVLDRMVLGVGREAVVPRLLRHALRDGPGGERAVALQAQVPVQAPRAVLVDHEPRQPVGAGSATLAGGLRRGGEVAFALVALEALRAGLLLRGGSPAAA